jgi:hypothetical protein
VLQKIAAMQKIDVLAPTTDGRELLPTYYTRSEPELRLLLDKLRLELPASRRRKFPAQRLGLDPRRSEDLSGRAPAKSITLGLAALQWAKWASGWRFRNFPADAGVLRPG